MSIYGDLSKPQREILRILLQEGAVSIDTAVSQVVGHRHNAPFVRLRDLGLIECTWWRTWSWDSHVDRAWLTPAGLQLVQAVRANAATSRYRRFRDASLK